MYPNSLYFGPKVVPIKVLWGQKICYLGTWTFRERAANVLGFRDSRARGLGFKG